jgi:hypothetical protein
VETGHDNILIGYDVAGSANDDNTTRIGKSYNESSGGGQNRAFIAGIRGTTVTGGAPVAVNANNQLGTAEKLGAGLGYG